MDAFFTGNVSGKRVRLLPAGLCNWSDERGKVFRIVTKLFILILRTEQLLKIYINMKKGEGRE